MAHNKGTGLRHSQPEPEMLKQEITHHHYQHVDALIERALTQIFNVLSAMNAKLDRIGQGGGTSPEDEALGREVKEMSAALLERVKGINARQ